MGRQRELLRLSILLMGRDMLDVEHEHVTSLRPGEHFYQLVVPCAGMALIIAGPNGWACFGTRILIAAALQ